jgi:hypothetical protein
MITTIGLMWQTPMLRKTTVTFKIGCSHKRILNK